MKGIFTAIAVVCIIAAMSFISNKSSNNNKTGNSFAVVELFTSEGCSSCPPADAALAKLKTEYGNNVYLLAYHVDYWNRLGWKDEFSSSEYSRRQGQYSSLFHLSSVYTPQAIVNGIIQFTGSNVGQLHSSIRQQLDKTTNMALPVKVTLSGNKVLVSCNTAADKGFVLHTALIEKSASSKVTAGENAGRSLQHVNVVRDFATADIASGGDKMLQLQLPAAVSASNASVIVFIQNIKTGEIKSVAETALVS